VWVDKEYTEMLMWAREGCTVSRIGRYGACLSKCTVGQAGRGANRHAWMRAADCVASANALDP
jgi:hypothetical protein